MIGYKHVFLGGVLFLTVAMSVVAVQRRGASIRMHERATQLAWRWQSYGAGVLIDSGEVIYIRFRRPIAAMDRDAQRELCAMDKLTYVRVSDDETDEGIEFLLCCPSLEVIDLRETGVTDNGVWLLTRRFPSARILPPGETIPELHFRVGKEPGEYRVEAQ